jgi:hypothetical protein
MSFLTSFCDFPQKEQVRLVWLLSRLSATMWNRTARKGYLCSGPAFFWTMTSSTSPYSFASPGPMK